MINPEKSVSIRCSLEGCTRKLNSFFPPLYHLLIHSSTSPRQDYVPEDLESISSFEPPQSPEASYNNSHLGNEDFSKEPPFVPPHLQMTLLNLPSTYMEIPSRPQHVVLNHLYMQKGRNSPAVVALGSTHRFVAKYVTVVLYKSLQR
ncbi:unnamed protein product [Linum tenue]|uniref:C2H2-type domain-containing protein n=1 Tax=Linum tenue TaxID=586396 RepID=A0AAV0M0G9_9ROSI|nr:unnamed protein product [Linum tenue]